MIGMIKRVVAGGLVSLILVGGSLAMMTDDAAAYTRTYRSDDGKLVLVCHYDDRTGELAFCDVYWFPVHQGGGAVATR